MAFGRYDDSAKKRVPNYKNIHHIKTLQTLASIFNQPNDLKYKLSCGDTIQAKSQNRRLKCNSTAQIFQCYGAKR